ncbi:MAG: hypothetical protein WBF42_03685, partial [Terracidiphilus sp.]
MDTDRRAILSLIASGRITPREAERLLAVSSGSDEATVRLALFAVMIWLVIPHAHQVIAGVSHALVLAFNILGGKL